MSKGNDIDQLKEDLEHLAKDFKNIFGSFKDTFKDVIRDQVDSKKSEFEEHIHKIKSKISEKTPSSSTLKYIGIAFVVGIIAGTLINKKKDE